MVVTGFVQTRNSRSGAAGKASKKLKIPEQLLRSIAVLTITNILFVPIYHKKRRFFLQVIITILIKQPSNN